MKIDQLHFISQQTEQSGHIEGIKQALDAGCKWIQLRIKRQREEFVTESALQAKTLCDLYNARLIINDYPQAARDADAYGLHLGLKDMPLPLARTIAGPDMIIGGTANTFSDVLLRVQEGADYIGLGPYRFTATKENLSPILGLSGYQNIMQQVSAAGISIPVIAIGGIQQDDVPALLDTGVYGIAISGSLLKCADKSGTVKTIYHYMNNRTLFQK